MRKKKILSVIVPAYKQAKTIYKDLKNIDKTLSLGLKDYSYEIICVVDGTVDKTYQQAKRLHSPKIKVFGYEHNKGKGYAIRYGVARSKGDLISFLDAGREISPASIMMLMAHLEWYKADIIVGSKRHPASRVNYPFIRRILSLGYHFGTKVLFNISVKDTQSGIKVFKRRVMKKVLPRLLVKQYAMDIEILAVARMLGFKRIFEAPIELSFDRKTSSISWKTIMKQGLDTMAVFYRLRIRRYYHEYNKRKWIYDPELDFRINIG